MEQLRVLELFSGIGGMHYAFRYAELSGDVVMAVDINSYANKVYIHNHSGILVKNNNIQSLTSKQIDKIKANVLLMSPPCQPHTRQGLQKDIADNRSDALQHICQLLPDCKGINYVLMENVKGFETSQAHKNFIDALTKSGYYWREFILTPTQFGVPNTRHRYYCIARKFKDFNFAGEQIWQKLPYTSVSSAQTLMPIDALLETSADATNSALLPEKVLTKRVWLMDIVNPGATNTMCFTKGYTHYSEGTGSVFTPLTAQQTSDIFKNVKHLEQQIAECDDSSNETVEQLQLKRLQLLHSLRLRYFTPTEVARMMSFPTEFGFPADITVRQQYRLLGNSINVKVVGELLKILFVK